MIGEYFIGQTPFLPTNSNSLLVALVNPKDSKVNIPYRVAVSFETAIFCSPESDILAMMENIEYPWSRTAKSDYKISDAVHQDMAVFL